MTDEPLRRYKPRGRSRERPVPPREADAPSPAGPTDRECGSRLIDVERLDAGDPGISAAAATGDVGEMLKPLYTYDVLGRRVLRLEIDVHGFDSDQIRAQLAFRKLVVLAVRRSLESGQRCSTQLVKTVRLPLDVELDALKCLYDYGTLVIEAPVTCQEPLAEATSTDNEVEHSPRFVGDAMHLTVNVGTLFESGDIRLKLKRKNVLLVVATRRHDRDGEGNDVTEVNFRREIVLSKQLDPLSLRAILDNDGRVSVTATALH